MLIITMTAYRRPDYTAQVLEALARCDGIADCFFAPTIDPDLDTLFEMVDLFARWRACPSAILFNPTRKGCNTNTHDAIARGFTFADDAAGDAVLHLEDDVVPARDALRFVQWGLARYRNDTNVMSISLAPWHHHEPDPHPSMVGRRTYFAPWGWATWRDRWETLTDRWDHRDQYQGWDVNISKRLMDGRVQIAPHLSRMQNIGATRGVHVPSAAWHARNHSVPIWSNDLATPVRYSELDWVQSGPKTWQAQHRDGQALIVGLEAGQWVVGITVCDQMLGTNEATFSSLESAMDAVEAVLFEQRSHEHHPHSQRSKLEVTGQACRGPAAGRRHDHCPACGGSCDGGETRSPAQ